jgi:hypothetical protein
MKLKLLFIVLLPMALHAQETTKGLYGGLSAGYLSFNTYWYYYRFDSNPARYNYPHHSTGRFVIGLNLDKKSVLQAGSFRFDIDGELMVGPGGKTKGKWLPGDEQVSGGGWTLGLGGLFKAAYPFTPGKGRGITAALGLGPQFVILHNNGKNPGRLASRSYYDYTSGWNEFIILLQATAGVDLQFGSFVLTPELRFGITGFSSTDWEPNEDGVEMDSSPHMLGFRIKIAKKL